MRLFIQRINVYISKQCWAISGVWFLQIELGAQAMISTVVIGALENNASKDANEFLSITSEEASWFGEYII